MEHIVQFAVSIDDDAIEKKVEARATDDIIKHLQQKVANKIFQAYYYKQNADPDRDPLSDYTKDLIEGFLNENRDAIIEKTTNKLADKLMKTKKVKDILDQDVSKV